MGFFWSSFLKSLEKNKKNFPVLIPVLKQLKPITSNKNKIILSCKNQGVKFFLEKKRGLIEKLLFQYINKKVSLVFVLQPAKENKKKSPPLFQFHSSLEERLSKANISSKYRFDNFAVSTSNQVAFAAAQAVAQNPGNSYNPLFLYGGVGVGKTHLAQAIALKILESTPSKKILFSPGDQFTNELIESIRSRNTPHFRQKYRKLALLVIDDVQFIAGKEAVQEEFFHTFNSVISRQGQIILTSDKPPNKIKRLEERLRSRFSGGLIVDIQKPDFELRTAILLIKAKERNINIDIDAAKILAEQITDTRFLEGALISIYAKTINKKETIDLEAVEMFLQNRQIKKEKRILPDDVIKTVCSYYNISKNKLKSKSRISSLVIPRQIIMYILREKLNLKLEEIAYILKRKDHTTVIHGVEKINRFMAKDPFLKQEIDQILNVLKIPK